MRNCVHKAVFNLFLLEKSTIINHTEVASNMFNNKQEINTALANNIAQNKTLASTRPTYRKQAAFFQNALYRRQVV